MMNIYTVSFFGHRTIDCGTEIEYRLDKLLHDLITQKEYIDFLIGRDGEFDLLASAAIKRAIRSYGFGNTHFTLVLPYMKAEYRDNEKEYLDYYDEVEICPESVEAHPKSAIQIRKGEMITVVGNLRSSTFEKNGEKRSSVEIKVNEVHFPGTRRKPDSENNIESADNNGGFYDSTDSGVLF